MERRQPTRPEIDRFFRDVIDTVPHMEALLLIWEARPREWLEAELSERLFVAPELLRRILRHLAAAALIREADGRYSYNSSPERDALIAAVAETYRRELVRVSNLIHSKPSGAVREFARAFEFGRKKE